MRDPTENAALGLDHFEPHFLKFRKVRTDAVLWDQTIVATVVCLAHRGIDADLRCYSGDDQLLNATILKNGVKVGGEESAFARLVDDGFAIQGIKFRNDIMACLAADKDAPHRADIPNGGVATPADFLCRR